VWTENKKTDMLNNIEMGIDGIITDYPALALQAAEESGK
jgi:glycerophosphoryl diester phosphodiesterase